MTDKIDNIVALFDASSFDVLGVLHQMFDLHT